MEKYENPSAGRVSCDAPALVAYIAEPCGELKNENPPDAVENSVSGVADLALFSPSLEGARSLAALTSTRTPKIRIQAEVRKEDVLADWREDRVSGASPKKINGVASVGFENRREQELMRVGPRSPSDDPRFLSVAAFNVENDAVGGWWVKTLTSLAFQDFNGLLEAPSALLREAAPMGAAAGPILDNGQLQRKGFKNVVPEEEDAGVFKSESSDASECSLWFQDSSGSAHPGLWAASPFSANVSHLPSAPPLKRRRQEKESDSTLTHERCTVSFLSPPHAVRCGSRLPARTVVEKNPVLHGAAKSVSIQRSSDVISSLHAESPVPDCTQETPIPQDIRRWLDLFQKAARAPSDPNCSLTEKLLLQDEQTLLASAERGAIEPILPRSPVLLSFADEKNTSRPEELEEDGDASAFALGTLAVAAAEKVLLPGCVDLNDSNKPLQSASNLAQDETTDLFWTHTQKHIASSSASAAQPLVSHAEGPSLVALPSTTSLSSSSPSTLNSSIGGCLRVCKERNNAVSEEENVCRRSMTEVACPSWEVKASCSPPSRDEVGITGFMLPSDVTPAAARESASNCSTLSPVQGARLETSANVERNSAHPRSEGKAAERLEGRSTSRVDVSLRNNASPLSPRSICSSKPCLTVADNVVPKAKISEGSSAVVINRLCEAAHVATKEETPTYNADCYDSGRTASLVATTNRGEKDKPTTALSSCLTDCACASSVANGCQEDLGASDALEYGNDAYGAAPTSLSVRDGETLRFPVLSKTETSTSPPALPQRHSALYTTEVQCQVSPPILPSIVKSSIPSPSCVTLLPDIEPHSQGDMGPRVSLLPLVPSESRDTSSGHTLQFPLPAPLAYYRTSLKVSSNVECPRDHEMLSYPSASSPLPPSKMPFSQTAAAPENSQFESPCCVSVESVSSGSLLPVSSNLATVGVQPPSGAGPEPRCAHRTESSSPSRYVVNEPLISGVSALGIGTLSTVDGSTPFSSRSTSYGVPSHATQYERAFSRETLKKPALTPPQPASGEGEGGGSALFRRVEGPVSSVALDTSFAASPREVASPALTPTWSIPCDNSGSLAVGATPALPASLNLVGRSGGPMALAEEGGSAKTPPSGGTEGAMSKPFPIVQLPPSVTPSASRPIAQSLSSGYTENREAWKSKPPSPALHGARETGSGSAARSDEPNPDSGEDGTGLSMGNGDLGSEFVQGHFPPDENSAWYRRPDVDDHCLEELCNLAELKKKDRFAKLFVEYERGVSFPLGEGGRELLRACLNAKGCKGRRLQGASVPMLLKLANDWGLWNVAIRIKIERVTGNLCPKHEAFVRFKAMQSHLRKYLKREQMHTERDRMGQITDIRFDEMKYLTLGKEGREKLRTQLRRLHDRDPYRMDELFERYGFRYSELRNATVPQLLKMAHICCMWDAVIDACKKQEAKRDSRSLLKRSEKGSQGSGSLGYPSSASTRTTNGASAPAPISLPSSAAPSGSSTVPPTRVSPGILGATGVTSQHCFSDAVGSPPCGADALSAGQLGDDTPPDGLAPASAMAPSRGNFPLPSSYSGVAAAPGSRLSPPPGNLVSPPPEHRSEEEAPLATDQPHRSTINNANPPPHSPSFELQKRRYGEAGPSQRAALTAATATLQGCNTPGSTAQSAPSLRNPAPQHRSGNSGVVARSNPATSSVSSTPAAPDSAQYPSSLAFSSVPSNGGALDEFVIARHPFMEAATTPTSTNSVKNGCGTSASVPCVSTVRPDSGFCTQLNGSNRFELHHSDTSEVRIPKPIGSVASQDSQSRSPHRDLLGVPNGLGTRRDEHPVFSSSLPPPFPTLAGTRVPCGVRSAATCPLETEATRYGFHSSGTPCASSSSRDEYFNHFPRMPDRPPLCQSSGVVTTHSPTRPLCHPLLSCAKEPVAMPEDTFGLRRFAPELDEAALGASPSHFLTVAELPSAGSIGLFSSGGRPRVPHHSVIRGASDQALLFSSDTTRSMRDTSVFLQATPLPSASPGASSSGVTAVSNDVRGRLVAPFTAERQTPAQEKRGLIPSY